MFKIAYCAGHYIGTPGKRVPKQLDPNNTREWVLNDRIADYFARAALEYEGVEILRTDDSTGKKDISIKNRTAAANKWGADLYLDFHHNAGIKLGTGGGVVAFSYPGSKEGAAYRDAIYNAVIAAGGLKGNRSDPLQEKAFDSLKYSKMAACLIEYGFMDSRTDYPVIATEAYAKAVAYGTMEGVAKKAGLKKKVVEKPVETVEIRLPVLQVGDRGDSVKVLQLILNSIDGCSCGNADGIFGSKTYAALRIFQKKNGLTVTGICDAPTWEKALGA